MGSCTSRPLDNTSFSRDTSKAAENKKKIALPVLDVGLEEFAPLSGLENTTTRSSAYTFCDSWHNSSLQSRSRASRARSASRNQLQSDMKEREERGECIWAKNSLPLSKREGPVIETMSAREEENSKEQIEFVNQYIFLRSIGDGSTGTVKLVINEDDEKLYAIKILSRQSMRKRISISKSPSRKDYSVVDGLEREIAILKKLEHPNVVNLWEVINDPTINSIYLVFEYVPNGSVQSIFNNRPLSENKCKKYIRDLISGLEYVHTQGVCHGDIKPDNLLITDEDGIKIADFGISYLQSESMKKKMAGMGTPLYTAPEVLRHHEGQDKEFNPESADIWAVGITLYELIFGKCPFVGENVFETYNLIKTAPLQFTEGRIPSEELKDLLIRILEKDPRQRLRIHEIRDHPWFISTTKKISH